MYQIIRELIIIVDKELDNFPPKDIELKNRIRNLSFDILELTYEANSVSNLEKRKEFVQIINSKQLTEPGIYLKEKN